MFESLKKLLGLSKKEIEPTAKVEEVGGDSGKRISERDLDEFLWDLELVLLEADVALPIVEEIKASVRADLLGKRVDRSYKVEDAIELALKNAVRAVLKGSEFDFDAFVATHERPVVIMFLGINGTGKTTVIAKIAHRLQGQGLSVVLSASDTFRAGAIEQLAVHGERLGAKVVRHQAGGDPAAVAYDAVEHAKARKRDVVLVDTAGRMQTNANLMDEMKKKKRVVSPHLWPATTRSSRRGRSSGRCIDAVILTKIDADAKGGAALSIAHSIKKPIAFLSTGQGYEDLIRFDSQWMVDRLFGNGRE
jgi:fused signal recognition particle receptor